MIDKWEASKNTFMTFDQIRLKEHLVNIFNAIFRKHLLELNIFSSLQLNYQINIHILFLVICIKINKKNLNNSRLQALISFCDVCSLKYM